MYLHLKILGMTESRPPEQYGDTIIFTFKTSKPADAVWIKFAHEGFTRLHIFTRNDHGVFFLFYPLPQKEKTLKYRLFVDGLPVGDPKNPRVEKDLLGIEYSILQISRVREEPLSNPRILKDNTVIFEIHADPNQHITLAGDFNDWDPFMHVLEESPAGIYRLSIRVTPGRHYYYYYFDGKKQLDPYNRQYYFSDDGRQVCSFLVP